VSTLLDDLLAGIRTPERPRSPVDANVTDEELYRQRNPEVYYCYTVQLSVFVPIPVFASDID